MTIAFHRGLVFCVLYNTITSLAAAHPAPQEPPLKCEITRGAWCIVKGVGKVEASFNGNVKLNNWTIFDDYWKKEVGVVIEEFGCVDTVADSIEVVQVNADVLWDGRRWREVLVRLRKDNACSLRVLVPTQDQKFLKKAASSLSGHLAVCLNEAKCTENILSPRIYNVLVTGDMPSQK